MNYIYFIINLFCIFDANWSKIQSIGLVVGIYPHLSNSNNCNLIFSRLLIFDINETYIVFNNYLFVMPMNLKWSFVFSKMEIIVQLLIWALGYNTARVFTIISRKAFFFFSKNLNIFFIFNRINSVKLNKIKNAWSLTSYTLCFILV